MCRRSSFLEIRDRESRAVVTVIELLSPADKNLGPDREQYIAKRRQLHAAGVNLVEIDLLHGGPRLPLEELPDCDYYVLVSRREERPRVGLWPIRLRERLPVVPVPLDAPDPPVDIDLQELLHRVYDAARYRQIHLRGKPPPPSARHRRPMGGAVRPPRDLAQLVVGGVCRRPISPPPPPAITIPLMPTHLIEIVERLPGAGSC